MNSLLLSYLRRFPVDYGKRHLDGCVRLPTKEVRYETPSGVTFRLDVREHVMRQIWLRGIYERNTIRHLLALAKPTMTFVDVGANVGAYSLTMSRFLSDGRVVAFEPGSRARRLLEDNILYNRATNVFVEPIGLSDRSGEATLFVPSLTTASMHKAQEAQDGERIRIDTLDNWCRRSSVDTIDLLKIDVEGHELNVLRGADQIIANSPNMVLIMEIDDNCSYSGLGKDELFQLTCDYGFSGFLPRGFPFRMKAIKRLPESHADNVIFIKGTRRP